MAGKFRGETIVSIFEMGQLVTKLVLLLSIAGIAIGIGNAAPEVNNEASESPDELPDSYYLAMLKAAPVSRDAALKQSNVTPVIHYGKGQEWVIAITGGLTEDGYITEPLPGGEDGRVELMFKGKGAVLEGELLHGPNIARTIRRYYPELYPKTKSYPKTEVQTNEVLAEPEDEQMAALYLEASKEQRPHTPWEVRRESEKHAVIYYAPDMKWSLLG